MEKHYDVYFAGRVQDGRDPQRVREQLGKLFNADEATLDRLFSGKPSMIKGGCDRATAQKYKNAMEQAGAVPVIRAQQAAENAAASRTAAEKIAALAAAPDTMQHDEEREEQAAAPEAGATADAGTSDGDIELAPPGTEVLRENERAAPVTREVDTSELQVDTAAARLSDKSSAPPPALDTSHLSMAEAGATIPNLPSSDIPLSPHTDDLSLSEPGTDFSDCAAPDVPPPELDLSSLSMEPAGSDILEERYRKQEQVEPPSTDHLSLGD